MNPLSWRQCLRQDEVVLEKTKTKVLRMQMNLRYTLAFSDWAQITLFVVTIRPDSANRLINNSTLLIGNDYIDSVGQSMNPRVSSDLFKVHYTRNVTMSKNTFEGTPIVTQNGVPAFDPSDTYRKGQVTIKMNHHIRNPTRTGPWKDMEIDQFSPNERYYLLAFFTQRASTLAQGQVRLGAKVDYDALFTTMNST